MRFCLFLLSHIHWLITGVAVIGIFFLTQEKYANWTRDTFQSNQKKIYSYAEMQIPNSTEKITVYKVLSEGSLVLEALFEDEGRITDRRRLVLPQSQNAFMNFKGQYTDLVLSDFDNDGTLELVAPAFDNELIPRINIFRLDPENHGFTKLGPGSTTFF